MKPETNLALCLTGALLGAGDAPNGMISFDVREGAVVGLTYEDGETFAFTRRADGR